MNKNIKHCCCCGRQIVKQPWDRDLMAPMPATHMGCGTYSCAECAADLDENGLFPEEREDVYA